jgi:predicted transcriptional regulator of viral defense system
VRATLWSRGRGVVSLESAAVYHELGEIDPLRTHLTVPTTFRARHAGVVLHHLDDLRAPETTDHGAFRVTTPLRTLVDVARSGTDLDQLARAVDALRRHQVTADELRRSSEAIAVGAALAIERALAALAGS